MTTLLNPLLRAVRRRLWRDALAWALRRAAWAAALLALAAAAWHRWVDALTPATLAALVALPVLVGLAWAASRRPGDAACAHFADRHLGGASAYGTWLDQRHAADSPARQHLRHWVGTQLPVSLQNLARARAPWRLAQPLATLSVCGALAAFVVMRPPPSVPVAVGPSAAPTSPGPAAPASATAPDLAGDLASALRAQAAAPQAERRRAGAAAGESGGRASDAQQAGQPPAQGLAASPRQRGADRPSEVSAAEAARANGGTTVAAARSGATAGRDAGDSRGLGGPGASRAAPAAGTLHRRDVPAMQRSETMSDDARAGRFDDTADTPSAAGPLPDAAPAMPPTATADVLLSPAQARYVQAWRQALR